MHRHSLAIAESSIHLTRKKLGSPQAPQINPLLVFD